MVEATQPDRDPAFPGDTASAGFAPGFASPDGASRPIRWLRTFFPLRWTQLIGPVLLAGAGALLLAVVVVAGGVLDLAASTPHPRGWASLLHYTFRRSTTHHAAGAVVPADFGTSAQIAEGAAYYGTACAHCHGGPGLGQNPVALSMTPRPQYLVHEVPGFSDRELFYIVKHGVKYSGMPAYPVQDREDEMWSVVSFLRAMPRMSTAQYRALAYGERATAVAEGDARGDARGNGRDAVPALANGVAVRPYVLPHSDEPPLDQYRYGYPSIGFDAFSLRGNVVQACERCHTGGGVGRANGAIPNIALLDAAYFRTALQKYASGNRHSGFMQPVATQLDPAQIEALARYYGARPRVRSDTAFAAAPVLAAGGRIAGAGLPRRGIGACASCHDAQHAAAEAFPAIDGQHRLYLAGRMRQFRAAPPTGGGGNPMIAIAKRLTLAEIDAVAAFYAARSPWAPRPTDRTTRQGPDQSPVQRTGQRPRDGVEPTRPGESST